MLVTNAVDTRIKREQSLIGGRDSSSESSLVLAAVDRLEVAILLLDLRARVLQINAHGRELLLKAEALRIKNNRLQCSLPADRAKLHNYLNDLQQCKSTPRSVFSIRRCDGGILVAQIIALRSAEAPDPLASHFMMVITDPDADCWSGIEEVAAIYGLTRRECSLVLHLAQGYTLKEAARRMDVQETTARNHLARAIARTGAKGQAGLMQLLLRSRVPVR